MTNVAKIFGKAVRTRVAPLFVKWVLSEQLMGVEIEVESRNGVIHPTNIPSWRVTHDGSLVNGVEYVLATPMSGDRLGQAVGEVFSDAVFTRSTTGSTHIHLDMTEDDTTQEMIKVLVLLAFSLEPAIFAIADRGREWCGYTNKLSSAPDAVLGCVLNSNAEDGYDELLSLCSDGHRTGRYYGLNLLALQKYGSIEYRYFPTATSKEELISWIQLVMSMKKAALELGSVQALCQVFSNASLYEAFISNYFGSWREAIMSEVPQYLAGNAIRKGLAVASSYAASQTPREPFNPEAITGNKVLSKFVKKSKLAEIVPVAATEILVVRPYQNAPTHSTVPFGTVLVTPNRMYVASTYGWEQISSAMIDLPRQMRDTARAAIEAGVSTLVERMTAAEYTPAQITNTMNIAHSALNYLGSSLTPPTPHGDEPPRRRAPTMRATPVLNDIAQRWDAGSTEQDAPAPPPEASSRWAAYAFDTGQAVPPPVPTTDDIGAMFDSARLAIARQEAEEIVRNHGSVTFQGEL